ncbi:MAG: twin-arginine translocase subunit TatB [Alphaproteobacteria bacterium]|nr:twin-arginine translocase subunit TatB [Alphaproteobacteria bacterium]
MFDIGWTEMLVVIVVAVIIIGPKDLPRALRTVGQWAGKVRAIGRDFQRGLDDMIRETELDEMKKQLDATRQLDIKKEIENTIDPTGSIKEAMQPIKIPDGDSNTSEGASADQPDSEPKDVASVANADQPDSEPKDVASVASADVKTGT